MKYYGLAVLNVTIFVLSFGVIGPMLISAKSTELFVMGVAALVSVPLILWYINKSWIMKLMEKVKSNEQV